MSLEHLLSTPEAATKLGVSPATLVDWRFRRKGPKYTKIGRLIRYRDQDLADFLQDRLVDPSARDGGPSLRRVGRRIDYTVIEPDRFASGTPRDDC